MDRFTPKAYYCLQRKKLFYYCILISNKELIYFVHINDICMLIFLKNGQLKVQAKSLFIDGGYGPGCNHRHLLARSVSQPSSVTDFCNVSKFNASCILLNAVNYLDCM